MLQTASYLRSALAEFSGTQTGETGVMSEYQDSRLTLSVELAAINSLGCACTSIHLQLAGLQHAKFDELCAYADRLCHRVHYLLEPLASWEGDRELGTLRLRSKQPSRRTGWPVYYELTLATAGCLTIERYGQTESGRERIPVQLTHEMFDRLLDDCVLAVTDPQPHTHVCHETHTSGVDKLFAERPLHVRQTVHGCCGLHLASE